MNYVLNTRTQTKNLTAKNLTQNLTQNLTHVGGAVAPMKPKIFEYCWVDPEGRLVVGKQNNSWNHSTLDEYIERCYQVSKEKIENEGYTIYAKVLEWE